MRSKADETLVIVETLICPLQISSASFDNISFLRHVLQKLLSFHDFFLFLPTRCRLLVHFNWQRAKIGVEVSFAIYDNDLEGLFFDFKFFFNFTLLDKSTFQHSSLSRHSWKRMVAAQADMFRLQCYNFDLTKPASWAKWLKTSLSVREALDLISGPVPAVSSVVKRTGYPCERSGIDSRAGQINRVSPTAR